MLNIGRKTFRNLPEQVGYLTGEVLKIWEALDGLDVYDNVIILDALDPLTQNELEIVNKPVAFIVYNNTLYMKRGVGVDEVYFDAVFQVANSGGIISFNSSEITVSYPLGTLSITNTSTSTYDKDEIDTLLSGKPDNDDVYTKAESLLACYPVGAYYISDNNTSPASLFGGTWEALNSGNKVTLSQANGDVPVKTKNSLHSGGTDAMAMGYTNGTLIEGVSKVLGIHTNGFVHYGTQAFTADVGAQPINLWADTGTALEMYIWKRVA